MITLAAGSTANTTASFFGLNSILIKNKPSVPFADMRLWNTGTAWKDLNTASGVYNWAPLDAWLGLAASGGKNVLYTLGQVPTWAGGGAAFNTPPSDIANGNQQWKTFITALVTHARLSPYAKISAYELWNEPDLTGSWNGTAAQLVQMSMDAYAVIRAIDPTAIITGPSPSTANQFGVHFLPAYYAAGGALYQDVVACHGYTYDSKGQFAPTPNGLLASISSLKTLMQANNIGYLPIWYTEGNWGNTQNSQLTDDQKIAYLAQYFLYLWANGVARGYWYAWDDTHGFGPLWDATLGILPAGTAYGYMYQWLVGTAQTGPLAVDINGTWTVNFNRADGSAAQILWNPTARNFPTAFQTYYQLNDPTPHTIPQTGAPIGNKPMLLN